MPRHHRAVGIALNVMKFKSKVDCRVWVEQVLTRFEFNIPISSELEPFVYGEIDALVDHHSYAKALRGPGIDYFYLLRGMKHKIGVHRVDNTSMTFSLAHTIAQSHPKIPIGAFQMMWAIVKGQTKAYADASLGGECASCNASLSEGRYAHYPEGFNSFCNNYILAKGYYSDEPEWLDEWKIFHRDNAILRLVCGECKV